MRNRFQEEPASTLLHPQDVGLPRDPHATDALAVTELLEVDPKTGLSSTQVEPRRGQFGANTLRTIRPRSPLKMLLEQFGSLVVGLLAIAALVAFLTADVVEGLAILVVLVLNALAGFLTEWRAGHALELLRSRVHINARVRRGGAERIVPAEEIVPGDIIILSTGDPVPADARVISASALSAEESALTGESSPVAKSALAVPASTLPAERSSMVFLGTCIVAGHATCVVTSTGAMTELGKIGRLVAITPSESTPLKRNLDQLGRRLVYIVLAIGALTTLAGWLRGTGFFVMVEVGISLAIAAVPEALPAVTTLILALGVLHMARHHAIVRRLASVETLGSATVICTDKTGTLTQNRMAVREYRLANGSKVEPERIQAGRGPNDLLTRALRAGVLCSEAGFNPMAEDESRFVGDPTETALLKAADDLGLNIPDLRSENPKIQERPFDGGTKLMYTAHRTPVGNLLGVLKGAPGAVLECCASYVAESGTSCQLDSETRARFLAANEEMAGRAMRVLGLAERSGEDDNTSRQQSNQDYTFLGFVGMMDRPRPGVAEALGQARVAGVRVVMLTGDQMNTARAIARELGIGGPNPYVVHARDLAGIEPDTLAELARKADAFARVSPEDKLRIVEALQQSGEIVAVTGDGVNDAPALKRADIGIAMGRRGTEVAKEAADVVLADDNFATLVLAVEAGRAVYANITRFVHLMFSKNLGAVLAIFTAIAVGWSLPLLPLQILWLNLVTDVFPAMALAVEPPTPGAMRRSPRRPKESLLARPFLALIAWQGLMLGSLVLASYWWSLHRYGAGPHSRTVVLMTLIGAQLGHMFNCRSRRRSAFAGLFRNPFVWAAAGIVIVLQLAALYLSPLAKVLNTVRPAGADWLVVVVSIVTPMAVVEIAKLIGRRMGARGSRRNQPGQGSSSVSEEETSVRERVVNRYPTN